MDLVVFNKAMVKSNEILFHDLSSLISEIEKSDLMMRLKDISKQLNYRVNICSGILNNNNQIDEYVEISVEDKKGNTIKDSSGSILASYEPVYIHLKNGKLKKCDDCVVEILSDVLKIINLLVSGLFVVEGVKLAIGIHLSNYGSLEVQQTYKKHGLFYSTIQLLDISKFSGFPRIGDFVEINHKKFYVVMLGDEF